MAQVLSALEFASAAVLALGNQTADACVTGLVAYCPDPFIYNFIGSGTGSTWYSSESLVVVVTMAGNHDAPVTATTSLVGRSISRSYAKSRVASVRHHMTRYHHTRTLRFTASAIYQYKLPTMVETKKRYHIGQSQQFGRCDIGAIGGKQDVFNSLYDN